MEQRPIVITGFMCAGKTSVAHALGERLGREATDLDKEITLAEGRTPAQLIAEKGEAVFREIETRVLEWVFEHSAKVIALGGGAWTIPRNRLLISRFEAISVWLDVPFDECWKRIVASGHRPLAVDRQQAATLFDFRRPIYELATIRLNVSENANAQELAEQIIALLPTGTPSRAADLDNR